MASARGIRAVPYPSRERRPLIRTLAGIATSAIFLCAADPTFAQDSPPQVRLGSAPFPLREGTIGWLLVHMQGGTLVGGLAAEEPIHFGQSGEQEYRGLVAVPLNAADSIGVLLYVAHGERVDTLHVSIPVINAGYPRETITVAPRFATPDPAAAARIRRENARSRQVSVASRSRPRIWDNAFQAPRAARITSAFGAARVYNGEVKSRHTGTDFAGPVGAPVAAAGRGVVAMVADFYLAGRAIYIDHGAGLVTAYFHLSRADVAQGDTVTAGQVIGGVGQSGRVTGPHLHWVARYGTISVDPMSLLELDKVSGNAVSGDTVSAER